MDASSSIWNTLPPISSVRRPQKMLRWIAYTLAVIVVLPLIQPAHGQKLKLPSLLPFKSQAEPVKPFRLTDQAAAPNRLLPARPMFGLFQPSSQQKNWLGSLNDKSRQFWIQAGHGISDLTMDTRDLLGTTRKRLESTGQSINNSWWNPALEKSSALFSWPFLSKPKQELPPLRPNYRMSQRPGDVPTHRF